MINPRVFGVSNLKISDKSICRNIDISIKPAFLVVKPSFLSRKNGGLPPSSAGPKLYLRRQQRPASELGGSPCAEEPNLAEATVEARKMGTSRDMMG